MMYAVKYAPDELMPEGHNWALCQEDDTVTTLFVRQSVRRMCAEDEAAVFEEAWAGANRLAGLDGP